MTGLGTMEAELSRLQTLASQCITESGHVKSGCRDEYNIYVSEMAKIREVIMILEGIYHDEDH